MSRSLRLFENINSKNTKATHTVKIPDKSDNDTTTIVPSIPIAGKFEKVSFDTFAKVLKRISGNPDEPYDEDTMKQIKITYDNIILPRRTTINSPIYNIYFPFGPTRLLPNGTILVPTGIKVKLNYGWCLQCTINPVLAINNDLFTHEIITYITEDRYNNEDDEGMIMFKLINTSKTDRECVLDKNVRLCSCLFVPYGVDSDDLIEEQISTQES